MDPTIRDWLLDGDPAIRWQVEKDLIGSPKRQWLATQARIATEGWGARLLELRDPDGRWAGGLYNPKWKSTTYTLLQLWRMGLAGDNRQAVESVGVLMDKPVWMIGRGAAAFPEVCIAGLSLSLSSWFTVDDDRRDGLVASILDRQLGDGGWNCRAGSRDHDMHSSFHTSINVLEGLRTYVMSGGRKSEAAESAETRGREFFAAHRMIRSHRTGRIPDRRMARIPFPPRWHHDVLRGLDYFRAAGARPDDRLTDPVAILIGHRLPDGRWPIHADYPGQVWFRMESGRSPSRWNTLRALRVLRWWDDGAEVTRGHR